MVIPVQNQTGGASPVIEVEAETFATLLRKMDRPLVWQTYGGFPKVYRYMTRYEGYLVLMRSKEPRDFTREASVVVAKKIHASMDWM